MTGSEDERTLRRYVLRQLDERQDLQTEARLLADDHFFSLMHLIEDELADDYVRDELSVTDRQAFQEHFQVSEERRMKLKVAEGLRERALTEGEPGVSATTAPEVSDGLWHSILRPWSPSAGLAATGTALVLGVSLIAVLPSARSGRDALAELTSTRQQLARTEQMLGAVRSSEGDALTASLTLSPNRTRSSGSTAQVHLESSHLLLSLQLPVPEAGEYRAVVSNVDTGELLSRSGLPATGSDPSTVTIRIQSDLFEPGDYGLDLFQQSETGLLPAASYFFRVTR